MGDSIERRARDAIEQRLIARIFSKRIEGYTIEAAEDFARAAIEAMPSAEEVENAARFLIDRLRDFDSHLTDDDTAREWFGHVSPAIARLDSLTSKGPEA